MTFCQFFDLYKLEEKLLLHVISLNRHNEWKQNNNKQQQ